MHFYWEPVTQDTEGGYLDASNLVYRIYVSRTGQADYRLRGETAENEILVQDPTFVDCYDVYATAVRTDYGMESEPSNVQTVCYPEDPEPDEMFNAPPAPPANFKIEWQ